MNIIRNKFVHLGGNVKIWHHSNIYGTRKYPVQIGDDTQVGSFCEVKPGVTIGRRCRLQSFIFISEMTEISDDVFIGPHVLILNDKYPTTAKIFQNKYVPQPARIAHHVTIGGGAIIGPDIKLGHHAVIGMGAVVVKSVAPYAIVAGNPARIIGRVNDKKYQKNFPVEYANRVRRSGKTK
ncbi:MAG: Transferase hexapeptide repeat containing protein [Candidatus Gottesmanbacteria bacterium GW2011_GWB1_43_11]|uniref:Transferase hexapeptide repeat containing protein n=1 Tax=Candidatus Gottesmanbacteria bacterium GW2011_GWB1_43_11 TaxID=1618446 RepID=A0A0G1EVY1_9BACT|nr:MAG: Transferase hexapeptide repeat containing protein [Candidatus Gottesmanbacteria bacterium GW2011_GWA2_42_16]KKS56132.1 MAG: Transferase hexapeptide repeat containing protein [Candidatus Gottesmanbacteria bacterium GW2011_GWA1_42_26]KKS82453.1 MAG: Transferase hexapeptide repeat containing protein [Candidatus Gottesmanbacteria bacterium GW2011_GWC1_43_10]KKS87176.1 MAG: Transferase hexapeptide repeat containing protein [Candidatus Gottesmanbacteria bacterium GW2011_GWB1_43_11]OGG08503.1 